jgi:hypothetical protein
MDEWQPIETAPKNGEHILVFAGNYQYVMRMGSFGFHLITSPATILPPYKPTHWMPLPEPPK